MISQIIIAFAIYWLIASVWCYTSLKKIFKKYKNVLRIETPEKYNAFLRMDFDKWDQKTLLKNSYTKFPIRFLAQIWYVGFLGFLGVLHKHCKLPRFIVQLQRRRYGQLALKLWLTISEQYDTSVPIDTPIVIANHSSHIDILYFGVMLQTCLAYLSKKEVKNMPGVYEVANYCQSIYVDRSSSPEAKQKIKSDILERVNNFKKDPKNHFPICIFPEGTVSNGRHVMQFKNGAFDPLAPITIFAFKYESKEFHMADCEMTMGENMFMTFCANCTLRVKKERVEPQERQDVEAYRERCRKILADMWGYKMYDVSFQDIKAYEKEYAQQLKQRKTASTSS